MSAAAYLIRGQVMHHRLRPAKNQFVYPVFCLLANVARLEELNNRWFGVNRRGLVSLQTQDYGPRDGSDLQLWIRRVLQQYHLPSDGEIWLQTFPRVLGFVFNPVSFWYCHDAQGQLRAVLADVNNTFGDNHRYLLVAKSGKAIDEDTPLEARKLMHVSPFCEVKGHYQFRFRASEKTQFVGIDYFDDEGLLIKTAIGGYLHAFNAQSVRQAVFAQPFLTLGVFAKIHWQALKLWLKKVPFFRQPAAPAVNFSFQLPEASLKSPINVDCNSEERSS